MTERSPNNSRWKVACFDLDGTLVRGTSTGQFLAERIGHADAMAAIENRYALGLATNAEVAALDGAHYRGYSVDEIHAMLHDVPTIQHIRETVTYLGSLGISSVLCTLAWSFVAEYFAARYGFAAFSGPALALDAEGRFTGTVASDFDESDKPKFVGAFCTARGLGLSQAFHVGDSRSDIPLFRAVGYSVALNAGAGARAAASTSVNSDSLLDVLPAVPGLRFAKVLRS